jgi:hypothetical protein
MTCVCCQPWNCFIDNPCSRKGIRVTWTTPKVTITNSKPFINSTCDYPNFYGGSYVINYEETAPQKCTNRLVSDGIPRQVTAELVIGLQRADLQGTVPGAPICCWYGTDDWKITGYILAIVGMPFASSVNFASNATWTFSATPAGATVSFRSKFIADGSISSLYFGQPLDAECLAFFNSYFDGLSIAPQVEIYDRVPPTYSCSNAAEMDAYTGSPRSPQNRVAILPVSGPYASSAECKKSCGNPLP